MAQARGVNRGQTWDAAIMLLFTVAFVFLSRTVTVFKVGDGANGARKEV